MRILKDEDFIRGDVPMTKEEIRTLSLAKLNISENSRVLDIGAGTGSVSLGAAVNCTDGEVISIEKEEKGIKLIKENCVKLGVDNLTAIHGSALYEMEKLQGEFDSIFIGGSGGDLKDIIEKALDMLKTGGSLVLNFITMRNALDAMDKLQEMNFDYSCVQIGVSVVKGRTKMLMANNPIFIINGIK